MIRRLLLACALVLGMAIPALAVQGRHVVDWDGAEAPGTIVIHTSERRLYFILEDGEALSFPIAVGREGRQWFGRTYVTHKRKNPGWTPTARMRAENPRLPAYMPPGPRNPLGVRAIYLAHGTLRIHGTNEPRSIGRAASSGCFRMKNEDVIDLYEIVQENARVIVRR